MVAIASPARADAPALSAGLLAGAEVSLALDMLQTLDIRYHCGRYETNPILGRHPSDAAVVGYFGAAMVGTAAATYLLPERWRFVVPVLVLALQVPQVARNASLGYQFRVPF